MTKTLSEGERPTANTGDVNVTELRNWAEEAEREIAKGGFTFKQRGTFRCLIGYALQAADALDRLGIISTVPDNEKLKPCGQCGSTDTGYLFGGKDADSCAAMCDDCGHKIVAPTIEEARIKWNAAYGTPNERAELAEKLQMALDIATPESGLLKADDVKRVIAILRATPPAAALRPLHFKLLRRGTRGTYIGLSDDMELRMAEMGALHDLHRLGLAAYAEQPKHDGPKSPRSSVITDAGRAALAAMPGRVDKKALRDMLEADDVCETWCGSCQQQGFCKKADRLAEQILSRLSPSAIGAEGWMPIAWLYEDELPKSYPYEAMFQHSAVRDGVRMFPVFAPAAQPDDTNLELLAQCYALLNDHYWEASGSPEEPPGPGDEWSYNIIPLFTAIQRATGKNHAELMALGNAPPTAQEG
jgi:hypothetical protein